MASTISPRMVEDAREEAARLAAGVAEAEDAARPRVGGHGDRAAQPRLARRGDQRAERPRSRSTTSNRADSSGQVDAAESRRAATRGRARAAARRARGGRAAPRAGAGRAARARGRPTEESAVERRRSPRAVETADAAVRALQAEVEVLRDELHASERERDALAARTAALSLAVDQKDGSASISRRGGIRGLVAEHMQVRAGLRGRHRRRARHARRRRARRHRDAALAALAQARDGEAGRVEIVVADAAAARRSPPAAGRSARPPPSW